MTAGTETGTARAALDSRVRTAVLGAIRAEDGNWSIGSPLADRVMEALGPVLDEAEAGRAKLAAVAALCRPEHEFADEVGAVALIEAGRILAILGSDEDERLRTHEHEWTRCPECKQPGQPCPCSGVACCEMERRETAAALDAARDERERIRQLAIRHEAFYDAPCPDGAAECIHQDMPFAGLLGSEGASDAT